MRCDPQIHLQLSQRQTGFRSLSFECKLTGRKRRRHCSWPLPGPRSTSSNVLSSSLTSKCGRWKPMPLLLHSHRRQLGRLHRRTSDCRCNSTATSNVRIKIEILLIHVFILVTGYCLIVSHEIELCCYYENLHSPTSHLLSSLDRDYMQSIMKTLPVCVSVLIKINSLQMLL